MGVRLPHLPLMKANKIKVKKSELMCLLCFPSKPLKDHKYFNEIVIHERTDCLPNTFYVVNANLFKETK